jgi:hypothetical protein
VYEGAEAAASLSALSLDLDNVSEASARKLKTPATGLASSTGCSGLTCDVSCGENIPAMF